MRALLVALVVAVSLAGLPPVGAQDTPVSPPDTCIGTIEEEPAESTVISIQGTRVGSKEMALLLSVAPDGSVEWVQNSTANGRWWAYDVDPLPNGTYLYATTGGRDSLVGEFDPATGEYVWLERFGGRPDSQTNPRVRDAHDADLVGDELIIADKGEGHERLLAYNLTAGRVTWEWRFDEHPEAFPTDGGGPPGDWTHVNDVDTVGEDLYLTSPRNFDKVILVNRTSGDIELTLGSDGNHEVLFEQHNPDHLWGPDGEHTFLVADSLNDRVVEYEYDDASDSWDRVWTVTGLDEPRDADRLANGNTLVTDRKGHRVLEVTPSGRTVWEVYTPYEPYDAERGPDESNGPTMREQGVTGTYGVTNDAGFSTAEIERCADDLFDFAATDTGLLGGGDAFTASAAFETGEETTAGGDPAATPPPGGSEAGLPVAQALAGLLLVLVALGLAVRRYR